MSRYLRSVGSSILIAAAVLGGATAQDAAATSMRMVMLRDGYRTLVKNGDLALLRDNKQVEYAARVGLQLEQPQNPLLLAGARDGRVYHLFFKTFESAFSNRRYVIQRIRKTERTWSEKGAVPTVAVTYQVEVFKTLGGALKRPDAHFGYYTLKGNYRREIVKECEIGLGEVPGKCEGQGWPFEPGKLILYLQRYGEDDALYRAAKFESGTKWSLAVALCADGTWSVSSPELGFDAPAELPQLSRHLPKTFAASTDVVLTAGKGMLGFESIAKSGGEELMRATFVNGKHSVTTDKGLLFSLDGGGDLYRIGTLPGFAGRIENGLRHGDSRARVAEVLGLPKKQSFYGWMWSYPGLKVRFDGLDRVERMWVDVD